MNLFARVTAVTISIIATVCCIEAVSAQEITWEEIAYNPAPAEDDVVKPLPCGGAMVFRVVRTGEGNEGGALSDRAVRLGRSAPSSPQVHAPQREFVSGPLEDEEGRFFLLAKYEVSARQYAAVMDSECPPDAPVGDLAQGDVGWFDAVSFTRRLTEWLRSQAPDSLPSQGDVFAYVRLPTEAEWEFAVRGGLTVSDLERQQDLFPHTPPVTNYAWHGGPQSSRGEIQYIGGLQPNPLGLHDMLGNVSEIMLEPFRLRRGSRAHGRVGGYVVRGGSVFTPRQNLHNGQRQERSFFSTDGRVDRAPDSGFRVMIAAPTVVSVSQFEAMRDAFRAIEAQRGSFESPIEALRALREDRIDSVNAEALAELEAEVLRIETDLERAADLASQRADDALRNLMMSGALLTRTLLVTAEAVEAQMRVLDTLSEDSPRRPRFEQRRDQNRAEFDEYDDVLGDLVRQISADYTPLRRRSVIDRLIVSLEGRGQARLVRFVEDFDTLVHVYSNADGMRQCELVRRAVGERVFDLCE